MDWRRRIDQETLHQWWRRGFGTFLVLALLIGLYLSYRPSGFDSGPELAAEGDATEAPADEEVAGGEDAEAAEENLEEPVVVEDELTDEEREELIAAARPPEETSVQVLDAGGGSTATNDVADALRDEGYDVVAINSSRADYSVTTVLYTAGNEAEADAMRARDERFSETGPNERLSEGVDLHVVVAPDWSG